MFSTAEHKFVIIPYVVHKACPHMTQTFQNCNQFVIFTVKQNAIGQAHSTSPLTFTSTCAILDRTNLDIFTRMAY